MRREGKDLVSYGKYETTIAMLTITSNRYVREDPRTFREGDIVEMAFSFVGVRVRDNKVMVFLNLKALTLLNDSFRRRVCCIA